VLSLLGGALAVVALTGSLAVAAAGSDPSTPPSSPTPDPVMTHTMDHDHAAMSPDGHAGAEAAHDHAMDTGAGSAGHGHALAPLAERERAATPAEQAAADRLVAETKAAAAPYADIDDAKAGGFVPNGSQLDNISIHYPHPANRRDDRQLDPTHPEGLMYRHNPDGTSTLLAVVYTVAAGEPAPTPGGPIFSWHTHQGCADFFVDPGGCPDTFRMLHVWIADGVVDPFAASFRDALGKGRPTTQ
jgi:hypothetical protein